MIDVQGPKVGQILLKEIKPSTGTSNGSEGNQKELLTPSSPVAGKNVSNLILY